MNTLQALQLFISATEHESSGYPIAEHHLPGIATARELLTQMRGIEVAQCVTKLHSAGMKLVVNLQPSRQDTEKSPGHSSIKKP